MQSGNGFWGIDLGGTKIEGVILPTAGVPEPILRQRIQTEADKGYDHILAQIFSLIESMSQHFGQKPDKIGIGTPGVLDPRLQTMKNCNTTALNGRRLKDDLAHILNAEVIIANDANCFALAETRWGAVGQNFPQARMVFGIIMGTGVGGGIVFDGKVWNGRHGIAGEWGHIVLDERGNPCYCGKRGCIETFISGPALEKYYYSLCGMHLSLPEICAATVFDEAALATIKRLNHYFGRALSVLTNLLDPDVIVVGGGLGNIESLYSEGINELRKNIFNNRLEVPILKPLLGDSAGVFGAAALTV